MRISRASKELRKLLDCKTNIKASIAQIKQPTNEFSVTLEHQKEEKHQADEAED